MPEQYDFAACRHLRVGSALRVGGELDDAAYHFGFAGESAVKHALRASGVEQAVSGQKKNPMRSHFPTLQCATLQARELIILHAKGRLAGPIMAAIQDPGFPQRFAGWQIEIRYADTTCTPVASSDCDRWLADAEALVRSLVIP